MDHKDIAKAYGIKIDYEKNPKDHCNYDGTQINALKMPEDGMIHEISHWVVAPEDRRNIPNYGLGIGPSYDAEAYEAALSKLGKNRRDYSWISDVDEEILTCALEFCFSALCGHDMIKLMRDRNFLEYGNPLKWESDDLKVHMAELHKRGIIDRFWIPVGIRKIITQEHRCHLTKFRRLVRRIT